MQKFNAVIDKLPVFSSYRGTEHPVLVPDPNQTQPSTPENGTEVLALEARCKANAVSPQKRSKQQKEDDGMAGSAVRGSRFRALEAIRESDSIKSSVV